MKYLTLFFILIAPLSWGTYLYPESDYQKAWCMSHPDFVDLEVTLEDGTRADCQLTTQAIEVDRAFKWAESIGQVRLYAHYLGLYPAVLLIVGEGEERYVERWKIAADGLGIHLYIIPEELTDWDSTHEEEPVNWSYPYADLCMTPVIES